MDGYEYERKCAKMLEAKGFTNITVTPGSGDQGVDIIAYKGTVKYGIQCKYYESNVGNKAVQEAFAGASFYDCAVAMVITSSTLTKPAHALAKKLKVEVMENIDAVYLHEATKAQSKAEQDRVEQIKKLKKSLQGGADKIESDLLQQLGDIFSQKNQELKQSILSAENELEVAIAARKSEVGKQLNIIKDDLQEVQQALSSIGIFRLKRKRELKAKEQELQNQVFQLEGEFYVPQSDTISQLQNLLQFQQEQLRSLDKQYSRQKRFVDSAMRLYRERIESYLSFKFPDEGLEIRLKSQLGNEDLLLERVKGDIIHKLYEPHSIKKVQTQEPFSQYDSGFLLRALIELTLEGKIEEQEVKGETTYVKISPYTARKTSPDAASDHNLIKTVIIDDRGWDINELPPVPTIENAEKYSSSGYWTSPYTYENIQEHILSALRAKSSITIIELRKSDAFLSVFSEQKIQTHISNMVKRGIISEDKSEKPWRYSLPKWALR